MVFSIIYQITLQKKKKPWFIPAVGWIVSPKKIEIKVLTSSKPENVILLENSILVNVIS